MSEDKLAESPRNGLTSACPPVRRPKLLSYGSRRSDAERRADDHRGNKWVPQPTGIVRAVTVRTHKSSAPSAGKLLVYGRGVMGLMSRSDVQPQVRKQHKFKVGQMVDYAPSRTGMSASSRGYKIVRLLPREGVDVLYRIKSAGETFERVAKEQDLTFRTAP